MMDRTWVLARVQRNLLSCVACRIARTAKLLECYQSNRRAIASHGGPITKSISAEPPGSKDKFGAMSSTDIEITIGDLARLTNGSATAKCGDTSVLVTAVANFSSGSGSSFLPLTVDYRQKASAAGRIPSNFLRRELGSSHHDILKSRMIDRALRPMFPENYNCETQIVCNLMAFDRCNLADVLAINAASTALAISDIPWSNPIGAVRVGLIGNNYVINPTVQEMLDSKMDLIVAANSSKEVVMLEGNFQNANVNEVIKGVTTGTRAAARVSQGIKELVSSSGEVRKFPVSDEKKVDSGLQHFLQSKGFTQKIRKLFSNQDLDKKARGKATFKLMRQAVDSVQGHLTNGEQEVCDEFSAMCRRVVRDMIIDEKIRIDGRSMRDIRPLSCKVDVHPPLHGSALFQRGQTQVLASVTLDSEDMMTQTDPVAEILVGRSEKKFMLHYEFPDYSTGDISKFGTGLNRREIGHGALAERALQPVIPVDFPFTTRVVTEVLESAGSSSMASVCAGSLALLDAGVKLSESAAGIAIGLVTRCNEEGEIMKSELLTDIQGIEDYMGDMDFKVAGTKSGITSLQADIKIRGVPMMIMQQALTRANDGIHEILLVMNDCIRQARSDRKDSWPVSEAYPIPANKRSKVIGVAGMNVKRIQKQTGVRMTTNPDMSFQIYAPNQQSLDEARKLIHELVSEENVPQLEFGNIYKGTVVELRKTGALISIHPDMDPVHVRNSQLDIKKIAHAEASGLQLGDTVHIKFFGRDPITGEERFSRKVLLTVGGASRNYLPDEEE